ncbi:MAG TPA: hypothetical protein VF120_10365 [Ktedonobacterales bacterium]
MNDHAGSEDDATAKDHANDQADDTLPADVVIELEWRAVTARNEVELRRALERRLPGYTLYRLLPAARRRWKCQYRIMFGDTYLDCQTVSEAYARALLAMLDAEPRVET